MIKIINIQCYYLSLFLLVMIIDKSIYYSRIGTLYPRFKCQKDKQLVKQLKKQMKTLVSTKTAETYYPKLRGIPVCGCQRIFEPLWWSEQNPGQRKTRRMRDVYRIFGGHFIKPYLFLKQFLKCEASENCGSVKYFL